MEAITKHRTATKNIHVKELKHGFKLTISQEGSQINIMNESGQHISIDISEKGLSLHTNAENLHLQANKEINLSAEKIILDAEKEINLKSKGNIITAAEKNTLQESGLVHKNVAEDQKIIANLGSVEVKANDDVKIDGERVLFNCED